MVPLEQWLDSRRTDRSLWRSAYAESYSDTESYSDAESYSNSDANAHTYADTYSHAAEWGVSE